MASQPERPSAPAPPLATMGDEERFRLLADHAPVMLWMSGLDGLCEFFNATWLNFTGRSLLQERGNGWAEGVHPDDFQDCMDHYLKSFVARQAFRMEYRLRRADGSYRWMSGRAEPQRDQRGQIVQWYGLCHDIEHEVEEERRRAASNAHDTLHSLAAILASAQAAEGWLAADAPNIERARLSAARIIRDAWAASQQSAAAMSGIDKKVD